MVRYLRLCWDRRAASTLTGQRLWIRTAVLQINSEQVAVLTEKVLEGSRGRVEEDVTYIYFDFGLRGVGVTSGLKTLAVQ